MEFTSEIWLYLVTLLRAGAAILMDYACHFLLRIWMNDSLAPAGRGPAKQGSGRRANDPLKFRLSHPHESVPINCTSDALSGSNKRKQTKPISLKRRYEKEFLAPEAVQRIADKASTYVPLPESSDQQVRSDSLLISNAYHALTKGRGCLCVKLIIELTGRETGHAVPGSVFS